jgi:hypothetical protein
MSGEAADAKRRRPVAPGIRPGYAAPDIPRPPVDAVIDAKPRELTCFVALLLTQARARRPDVRHAPLPTPKLRGCTSLERRQSFRTVHD